MLVGWLVVDPYKYATMRVRYSRERERDDTKTEEKWSMISQRDQVGKRNRE